MLYADLQSDCAARYYSETSPCIQACGSVDEADYEWAMCRKACEDEYTRCIGGSAGSDANDGETRDDMYNRCLKLFLDCANNEIVTGSATREQCMQRQTDCIAEYEGKGPDCPNKCTGDENIQNSYSDGYWDASQGQCIYDTANYCPYGCDKSTGLCKEQEQGACETGCPAGKLQNPYPDCGCVDDPCAKLDCSDRCEDQMLMAKGSCEVQEDGRAVCSYEKITGCEFCSKDKTTCIEICGNGLDDDLDSKTDCEDKQCTESYFCNCKKIAGDGNKKGKLNVVFVGKGFEKIYATEWENQFKQKLDASARGFSTIEPFKSKKNKINLYATMITKDENRASAMARCNTNSNDQYIILDADATGDSNADICGNEARINLITAINDEDTITMHEFGHSFGCLWDEYTYEPEGIREWLGHVSNLQFATHDMLYDDTNCATTVYSVMAKDYFKEKGVGVDKAYSGCTSPDWYRSTETSLMKNAWRPGEFNDISIKYIEKRFSELK